MHAAHFNGNVVDLELFLNWVKFVRNHIAKTAPLKDIVGRDVSLCCFAPCLTPVFCAAKEHNPGLDIDTDDKLRSESSCSIPITHCLTATPQHG